MLFSSFDIPFSPSLFQIFWIVPNILLWLLLRSPSVLKIFKTLWQQFGVQSTAKSKLKAISQEEQMQLWKQHFDNLLGNPTKVTHEPITRNVSKQLDIKLRQFTQEELYSVLIKIKIRKCSTMQLHKTLKLRTYLGRTKMTFGEIDPRRHKFWLSIEFLKVYGQKNLRQQYQLVTSPRPLSPYTKGRQINATRLRRLKETVAAIIMLYRNTKVKVRSPDGDTDYFDIVAGVLKGDTLAPYLFIICLEYVLITSIGKMKNNGFKLTKERSGRYPAQTITDADYADDIALLENTPTQAENLINSLEWDSAGIGLHVNVHKTEYIFFNQIGDISTHIKYCSLKLVDRFTYLGSSVASIETDINTWLAKTWTAIDKLSIIRKSDLTDKIKCCFFKASVVSILEYGCSVWTLTKRMDKKFDENYTRMLQVILKLHPTKQQRGTAGEVGTSS